MITIKITKEDDTVACEVRQNAKAGDLALELVSPGRAFAQMTRQFVVENGASTAIYDEIANNAIKALYENAPDGSVTRAVGKIKDAVYAQFSSEDEEEVAEDDDVEEIEESAKSDAPVCDEIEPKSDCAGCPHFVNCFLAEKKEAANA